MNKYPTNWAMLARDIDSVDTERLVFPMMGQPKLNGIRAMWTGRELVSRQRLIWPESVLPSSYKYLRDWSISHKGFSLDGELYCHGMPFQLIAGAAAIHQIQSSKLEGDIHFHAFDLINSGASHHRQSWLKLNYEYYVPVCCIETAKDIDDWLEKFLKAGYEGLMLRSYNTPYVACRSVDLIKVKPWHYLDATIVAFNEGQGKYKGTLGALGVMADKVIFKVSGGLSDAQRDEIWRNQKWWKNKTIVVAYREMSMLGIPLKPQIACLCKLAD